MPLFNFNAQFQNVKKAILEKDEGRMEIHFNLLKKYMRKENLKEDSEAFIAELKEHKPPLKLPDESPFPIDATDVDGNTLLILALQNRLDKAAELLINEGAWPHLTNKNGYSALDYALDNHVYRKHDLKIVLLLKEKGISFNMKNLISCLSASPDIEKLFDSLGNIDISKSYHLFIEYAWSKDKPKLAFFLFNKTGFKLSEESLTLAVSHSDHDTTEWFDYALLINGLTKTLTETFIHRLSSISGLAGREGRINQRIILNMIAFRKPHINFITAHYISSEIWKSYRPPWLNLFAECQFDKQSFNIDLQERNALDYAIGDSDVDATITLKLLEEGINFSNSYTDRLPDKSFITPAKRLALKVFHPKQFDGEEIDFTKLDTDFLAKLLSNAKRLNEKEADPFRLDLIEKIHSHIHNAETIVEVETLMAIPLTKIVSNYLFFPADNKTGEATPDTTFVPRGLGR